MRHYRMAEGSKRGCKNGSVSQNFVRRHGVVIPASW
jgi:hypothetical protein